MRLQLQLAIAAGMLSTFALAQEPQHDVIFERHGSSGATFGLQTFERVTSESFSFDGAVVRNSPYSAEAITETTQSLADGNRISRKTKSTLYRDSEGRTRREETLGAIGPWASADESQMISINDPVSKTNLVLDTKNKIARKMPSPKLMMNDALGEARKKLAEANMVYSTNHTDGKKGHGVVVQLESDVEGVATDKMKAEMAMTHARMMEPGVGVNRESITAGAADKESLGTQLIEGVQAEGTRTTITIPAGTIGNDLPIKIISERWYSPDLQTVVMSKHSDPRMGDTIYRLTNINRSEPSASLFQAPPDYTVSDSMQRFVIKNKD